MHALPVEFTFASFTFPRYIADLTPAAGLRRKREMRRVVGGYYHAPRPNQSDGWSFYLGSDFAPSRVEQTGDFYSCGDLDAYEGIIVRLNHGRGFLAGWTLGQHMASSVDAYIWTDESDARRAAADAAQRAAEDEFECQSEEVTE